MNQTFSSGPIYATDNGVSVEDELASKVYTKFPDNSTLPKDTETTIAVGIAALRNAVIIVFSTLLGRGSVRKMALVAVAAVAVAPAPAARKPLALSQSPQPLPPDPSLEPPKTANFTENSAYAYLSLTKLNDTAFMASLIQPNTSVIDTQNKAGPNSLPPLLPPLPLGSFVSLTFNFSCNQHAAFAFNTNSDMLAKPDADVVQLIPLGDSEQALDLNNSVCLLSGGGVGEVLVGPSTPYSRSYKFNDTDLNISVSIQARRGPRAECVNILETYIQGDSSNADCEQVSSEESHLCNLI